MSLRSSLFWDVTQRTLVSICRGFGTTSLSRLQGSSSSARPLKIGPISCPETSVNNYQSTLRNISEERRSHLQRGGILKTCALQRKTPCRHKVERWYCASADGLGGTLSSFTRF